LSALVLTAKEAAALDTETLAALLYGQKSSHYDVYRASRMVGKSLALTHEDGEVPIEEMDMEPPLAEIMAACAGVDIDGWNHGLPQYDDCCPVDAVRKGPGFYEVTVPLTSGEISI
jgi:hypothetical protein